MSRYLVTVTALCTMLVEVEAGGALEAHRRARAGDYEPVTPWEQYGRMRVVRARLEPNESEVDE